MNISASQYAYQASYAHLSYTYSSGANASSKSPALESLQHTLEDAFSRISLSPQGLALSAQESAGAQAGAADSTQSTDSVSQFLKSVSDFFAGQQVSLLDRTPLQNQAETQSTLPLTQNSGANTAFNYQSIYERYEQRSFSAAGTIETADGQSLTFQLDLSYTSYYREEVNISNQSSANERASPLFFKFNGFASEIQSQQFSFAFANQQNEDEAPSFTHGLGRLLLDRDHDHKAQSTDSQGNGLTSGRDGIGQEGRHGHHHGHQGLSLKA